MCGLCLQFQRLEPSQDMTSQLFHYVKADQLLAVEGAIRQLQVDFGVKHGNAGARYIMVDTQASHCMERPLDARREDGRG